MRKGLVVGLVILLVPVSALSQERWTRVEKTDKLRGTSYIRFGLTGKFLEAPERVQSLKPMIVIDCDPSKWRNNRHQHGELLADELRVGAVLDTDVSFYGGVFDSIVLVHYRQDDAKVKDTVWHHSRNFIGFTLYEHDLENFLYSHKAMMKENRSVAAEKIVIQVPEYLGGEIVMQFDLPDPTEVADSCGLFLYKKKQTSD